MAYIYRRGKYFWVGWKEGGQSLQKSLKVSSRDAAKRLLAEYQHREARSLHKSTLLMISKDLAEAVDEYIEVGNVGRSKETIRERKGALNRFKAYLEKECAGETRPDEISQGTVERHYHKRVDESLAGANKDLKVIKSFLNFCIKKGYCRENPANEVERVEPVKKIFKDLSFDEVHILLLVAKYLHSNLYPMIAAFYYLGLRKNELVFLEWSDVNLNRNVISIRSKLENKIKDCEERNIPINSKLREILKELPRTSRFVFPTPSGVPWKNNLYREFMKVAEDAKLDHINIQTMRETFGSHLLRRKVSIYLVSKYLGHSSVDVTTKHYAHIPIEETHEEIDLL